MTDEAKKLISEAKNVCIIPSQTNEPESLSAALALFYTLKELGKNVNLIIEDFPEKLNFLLPSMDFISEPKNFVVSIPRKIADISQVYYEKNEDNLKIHLTIEKGRLKKEDVSFYFQDTKPDIVIAVGIQDLQQQLSTKLDSFGFLLASTIINIDNSDDNKKFGLINMIENKSLAEITLDIIRLLGEKPLKDNNATCLLAGLMIHYENFKSPATTPEAFSLASELVKRGARHTQILDNIYKATQKEMEFLRSMMQRITFDDNGLSHAMLDSYDFENFSEKEAGLAVEKIKTLGMQSDLLVLWKSHNSTPAIRGFFYSKKPSTINKFAENQCGTIRQGWVFLTLSEEIMDVAKEKIISILH